MRIKLWKKSTCRIVATICAISLAMPSVSFADSAGWKMANGSWSYYGTGGVLTKGWLKVQDNWYYFDPADGSMKTGWLQTADGSWYFLNPTEGADNGKMLSSWQWVDGYCYYLGSSGIYKR